MFGGRAPDYDKLSDSDNSSASTSTHHGMHARVSSKDLVRKRPSVQLLLSALAEARVHVLEQRALEWAAPQVEQRRPGFGDRAPEYENLSDFGNSSDPSLL